MEILGVITHPLNLVGTTIKQLHDPEENFNRNFQFWQFEEYRSDTKL